jgi:hypothetical protein
LLEIAHGPQLRDGETTRVATRVGNVYSRCDACDLVSVLR